MPAGAESDPDKLISLPLLEPVPDFSKVTTWESVLLLLWYNDLLNKNWLFNLKKEKPNGNLP
jgi:hypothetical protein